MESQAEMLNSVLYYINWFFMYANKKATVERKQLAQSGLSGQAVQLASVS